MKSGIRLEIREIRDALSTEEILSKSRAIGERLFTLPGFQEALTVMFYVSHNSEVNTRRMITAALRNGHRIAVPLVRPDKRLLLPVLIHDPARDLSPGFKGILEPDLDQSRKLPSSELDLVIVPGLAFDPVGNRLGMGRAYYDAFLKAIRPEVLKIGLAFECQVVDSILPASHDVAMDMIITEKRVIDCRRRHKDTYCVGK